MDNALQQALSMFQDMPVYQNVNKWANQFGFNLPQKQIISPLGESDTLNTPGKLDYVNRQMVGMENAKVPIDFQPKTLQYPSWLANSPTSPTVQNYTPPTQQTNQGVFNAQDVPPVNLQTNMILNNPVPVDVAKAYIQKILQNYRPATPDVTPGWQTPLMDPKYVQQMANLSYQYKLHPALQPLLAIAETQLLRPAASGTPVQNPYNVRIDNQEFDYRPYGGLEYALNKFPANITQNWNGQGWVNFRQNPTLLNFIHAHNPVDNPQQEIDTILSLAKQLNLQ